jgi:hypothetical protein
VTRARTLTQLIAEVRDRADLEGALHITDAQITRYLNQSGAALHAMLVEHCQDEFVGVASGAVGAPDSDGATHVEVTAYKLMSVSATINGQDTRLERWTWADRPGATDSGAIGPPYTYRWIEGEVVIVPALPTGTIATVYAVPPYADMASGSDTYDGRDGWEEWVVWDSAIKCMVKEETDTREAVFERDQVLTRIKSQMKARDLANPPEVSSVGNVWNETYPLRRGW